MHRSVHVARSIGCQPVISGLVPIHRLEAYGHVVRRIAETKKPREKRGFDGQRWVYNGSLVPPVGFEPTTQGLRVPCSTN